MEILLGNIFSLFILNVQGFPGGSVVKNLPANQQAWVQSLVQEDPTHLEAANPEPVL